MEQYSPAPSGESAEPFTECPGCHLLVPLAVSGLVPRSAVPFTYIRTERDGLLAHMDDCPRQVRR